MHQVQLSDEAIVLRFRPSAGEAVLSAAEKAHRYYSGIDGAPPTCYRLSCFADVKRGGETVDDVLRRLIVAAQLNGMDLAVHKNCWWAASRDLHELGVTFWKDDDDDEVEEHYSFDLGTTVGLDRVEEVLAVFEGPERTREA